MSIWVLALLDGPEFLSALYLAIGFLVALSAPLLRFGDNSLGLVTTIGTYLPRLIRIDQYRVRTS